MSKLSVKWEEQRFWRRLFRHAGKFSNGTAHPVFCLGPGCRAGHHPNPSAMAPALRFNGLAGEGTGGQSYLVYDWKAGTTYKFLT